MNTKSHIPHLKTISAFYQQLRIGTPQGDDFAIMRIEEQPDTKLMEMPLFRCNFYRLVFFTNPGVAFHLPGENFATSANSIYFSYPGKLESWQTAQKIHGYLICFTEAFAQLDSLHSAFDQQFPFFNFSGQSMIHFSNEQSEHVKQYNEQILAEVNSSHSDYAEMIRLLLHQYLIQLRRIYQSQVSQISRSDQNAIAIFNRFRYQLDQYFSELAVGEADYQASVSLIADRLHLNPSYLNTLIKNLTGKTASSFINEKIILEAKSYLIHTDYQVAEISFRLGFTNVTYFNRFFKKWTQATPMEYRGKM